MSSLALNFYLLAALLPQLPAAGGGPEAGVVRVEVKDAAGATISGAHVLLRFDRAGRWTEPNIPDVSGESDAEGIFRTETPQGIYDLCVMADAFSPQCRKVLIQGGRTLSTSFKLPVDPVVSARIADRFE